MRFQRRGLWIIDTLDAQYQEKGRKFLAPSTWETSFRTFRSYADTVLEYLRKNGYNATFILRITTDKNEQMDAQRNYSLDSWKSDLDNKHQCKHYLYRGEAIFYGIETVSRAELKFIFDK